MTLVSLAFGAGVLATVSPCGFAMLPAFLAYYLGGDGGRAPTARLASLADGLMVGGAVSLGFAGVYIGAGLLASLGLRSLARYVPWMAVVVGVALTAGGLAMLAGFHAGFRLTPQLRPGTGRRPARMVVFGAAYALASLSCTLAVLLAVVAEATAARNPVELLSVLGAYGIGSATVLTGLAVSAAAAKAGLVRKVRRLLPVASRLGGAVLVASGSYMVAYWLPALARGSGRGHAPADLPSRLSGHVSSLMETQRGVFVALALALALAGTVAAVRGRQHRPATAAASVSTVRPPGPSSTPSHWRLPHGHRARPRAA